MSMSIIKGDSRKLGNYFEKKQKNDVLSSFKCNHLFRSKDLLVLKFSSSCFSNYQFFWKMIELNY